MKTVIYESPKGDHRKSAPIPADDVKARAILENAGWRLVQELADAPLEDEPAAAVAFAAPETSAEVVTLPVDTLDSFDFLTADQRAALRKAGYGTDAALRAATDAELRDVKGVGPGAVRNLRAALK